MKSMELRDSLQELIRETTGKEAFYLEADRDVEYPYYVFEVRRLQSEGGMERCVLEVNAWDHHPTSSRIEEGMDALEYAFHGFKRMGASHCIVLHKGERQPVADEDKEIRRVRAVFDLTVCERRGEAK